MKHYLMTALLLCCTLLGAAALEQYTTTSQGMKVNIQSLQTAPLTAQQPDPAEGDVPTPAGLVMRTYAFPYQQADLHVYQTTWRIFDREGNYLGISQNLRSSALAISQTFTFREMAGVTVTMQTQIEEADRILTLQDVEYELTGSQPITIPATISPAFIDAYKALADNYNYSYLRDIPVGRPSILIISHSQLSTYQTDFIAWKRSLGFDVYVANKGDIGSSLTDIKAFIQNHYAQHHCDYLFLWGDVSGTFSIPTNFYPSPEYQENDADDHYYTLLEGDDYFPEMIVGRFSFNDVSEFLTMSNKTISYESAKRPLMMDTTWMQKALLVAGNFAEGNLTPSTPISMTQWLKGKLLNYGYTQVDTVFFPPSYPGTSSIQSSISRGVQYVSYRGWGDANGWHYPSFHIPDLANTTNGSKMPIVFSIVCNTGDFANTVNPNFGEKWMRMGSMSTPNGCVAFVGPSDLHTKTRLNNSISSGAFRSILDMGVRSFGSSVLNGKIELYKTFPSESAPGQYVPFYYHVYNILSDPSLNMWSLVPQTIPESVFADGLTYSPSDSHIRILASGLDGAMVSGTKNKIDYTYATIHNGFALLSIDPEQTDSLKVTISKKDFVPLVRTLAPSNPAHIGIISNSLEGTYLNPHSTFAMTLGFKNFASTAYNNVQVTLSSSNPNVTISNATQNISSLAAAATTTLTFNFNTDAALSPGQTVYFHLNIAAPLSYQSSFMLASGGARIVPISYTGILQAGQANNVAFQVQNTGNADMSNITLVITSLTTAATAQSAPVSITSLAAGQTSTVNANITLAPGVFNGRNIPLRFVATDAEGYTYTSFFAVTAGVPGSDDPTGPDEYGYYAYDSGDTGFTSTPVYNWVEIDPTSGPLGPVFLSPDDGSQTVNLPFTFKYYGRDYNSITVCTNGWMSFVPTSMVDFYNCYIPAALGPYAMVAPYWDDLKGLKVAQDTYNDIRIITWHDTANNRFIIEWNNAYNQYNIDLGQDASLEKFQVILYPHAGQDGDIVFQYHTVDNPGITTNYCTVGIEDHTQMQGLTYTHCNVYPVTASTLASGLAIKFTTTPPDNYVANEDDTAPALVSKLSNYPNPFNPNTTIAFTLAKAGKVNLYIYNMKGQLVKTLQQGNLESGDHRLNWNGVDDNGMAVSSGLYLYRLETDGYSQTNKMLLMK